MKLLVPYLGELQGVDRRLIALAEFLGIVCQPISLPRGTAPVIECLSRAASGVASCLVIHPAVIHECLGQELPHSDLVSLLLSRFPTLLLHAPRSDPFDSDLISALSRGGLSSVQETCSNQPYKIAPGARRICGPFAGLTFGTVNPNYDHVFLPGPNPFLAQELISIGDLPFMTVTRHEDTEILFLAGLEIADLDAEVDENPYSEYFSRLLPHAMALRHIFGDESWHPHSHHACLIVDDPLLRPDYGFLNFKTLLKLMEQHHFHTSIAFVPHNFRRNSATTTRSIKAHSDWVSLCFHGNDHTDAEFASTDKVLLNTMLHVAEHRMNVHGRLTGIDCSRVMVFPQGKFSIEAMAVLRARNFDAAINTVPHPFGHPVRLTLREIAQPAVHRYASFPLFLRANSLRTQCSDIAFKLFFGAPIFIVEHHCAFRRPEDLLAAVARVNAIAPNVHWSSPATAVSSSVLRRRSNDGANVVRSYCRTVRITNDTGGPALYRIEWQGSTEPGVQVLRDGIDYLDARTSDDPAAVTVGMETGSCHTFAAVHRNDSKALHRLGLTRAIRGFVRRRASEVRDNYLSKNPALLTAASAIQRRFLPQRVPLK
jgi:hypothetical protein